MSDQLPTPYHKPASARSLNYFQSLVQQRSTIPMLQAMPPAWRDTYTAIVHSLHEFDPIAVEASKKFAQSDVSKFIDQLKKQPMRQALEAYAKQAAVYAAEPLNERPIEVPNQEFGTTIHESLVNWQEAAADTTPTPEVFNQHQPLEDGMYRHQPQGTIYKVYHTVHGANQQVAKRLIIKTEKQLSQFRPNQITGELEDGPVRVSFKYEGKAPLYFLKASERLSMAEAAEFGRLYGSCAICGRTLTNELSIAIGIGPICGEREFGGNFEFIIDAAKVGGAEKVKEVIDANDFTVTYDDEAKQDTEESIKAEAARLMQRIKDLES